VDTLRRERKTDRTLLEDEVLPRLAKLEEKSIDHETRLGLVEKRPAWPNVP
jgi:hypothetical protein